MPILTDTSTFGDTWAVPNAGKGRKQPTLVGFTHRAQFIHRVGLIQFIHVSRLLFVVERLIHKILR
jgi:hypothetical protein